MTLAYIIILLATGILTGFAGALLGLGGALIMTPVQYLIFIAMGIPIDIAIKLAFGTSLMVILPLAASSTWRHSTKGLVRWRTTFTMGGIGLAGAFSGATLATHLPGTILKTAFGAIVLLIAIRMLTTQEPKAEAEPRDNPWLWVAWAVPAGLVSGILGAGGGIVLVPVLALALRFRMHNAIATSLAIMLFTSAGGATGYIINGIGTPGLPAYSIGYVNLASWLLLTVTSVGMAQVGAITAHKLPAQQLKYIFIAVMLYMGLKMVGVFDWLDWPL